MDNVESRESGADSKNKKLFSPIREVSTEATQGKYLTGSACHIRSLVIDMHASLQQWNTLHLEGLTLLQSIIEEKQDVSYSQKLQELCDQLESVCDALDSVVDNLSEISQQINATVSLEHNRDKLFKTWPIVKFGNAATEIYYAYLCEAAVKRQVLEDVAHHHQDSWKMLFLATWAKEALLVENLPVLESLLVETGLR